MVARREVTEITEARDSITLKRSVKGAYNWDIKVYFEDSLWTNALRRIRWMDRELRKTYLESAEPAVPAGRAGVSGGEKDD